MPWSGSPGRPAAGGPGSFLPVEALRQLCNARPLLPAVIAALGYRSAEEEGELRFYAPDRKAGAKRRRRRAPAATAADLAFAALRDLKFTR
jgi:hypothetical protein